MEMFLVLVEDNLLMLCHKYNIQQFAEHVSEPKFAASVGPPIQKNATYSTTKIDSGVLS